jgi:hypothetical protein
MTTRGNFPLLTFRGIVSQSALARVDVERLRLSAETMRNWMPQTLGPMSLRPGLQYLGTTKSNATARLIPFVAQTSDTALLELTDLVMRIWSNDTLVTRPSVSSTITNGNLSSGVGWTTSGLSDATATFNALGLGFLELNCPSRGGKVLVGQSVTVSGADLNVVHAVRLVIIRGPITFRVGTATGDDTYVKSTVLRTGTHSLAFTPTGNFYVEMESTDEAYRYIDSITVESAGTVELPTPWVAADLEKIKFDQSADVMFIACDGYQQRRIERRDNNSWSVCLYETSDGPFFATRGAKVRMRSSGLTYGSTQLITDGPFFKAEQVGALFRIFANTQVSTVSLAREGTYTMVIRVYGNGASERTVNITTSGTWSGTLTLERSFDGEDSGFNGFYQTGVNVTTTKDLVVDNTEMWVRMGFRPGEYTSGTATVTLSYVGGGRFGIARALSFTSSTAMEAEILRPMPTTAFTDDWREGMWSDKSGWPTSVAFYEGRLWWFGRNAIWGSVSDAYDSFDEEVDGDSGPINRTIGSGPVDTINWALGMQRLLIGTAGSEISVRSTSFDEPLTPTAFNLKNASTIGSSNVVSAVAVDQRGIFIGRDGARIWQMFFSADGNDYESKEADILWPEAGGDGIVSVAVQRQPDTRVHFVREDGMVVVLTWVPTEEISPFVEIETDGTIEEVCVLPALSEDAVYYVVARTINGATVRYLERMAKRSETLGASNTRLSDAFAVYNGAATTTPTGWSHLIGETVCVWADGIDVGTQAVDAGGGLTLSVAASYVVAGLPYTALFKSAKLAYGAQAGTALMQKKIIEQGGVILKDTHAQGLQIGRDFDYMDDLPLTRAGATVDTDSIISVDEQMTAFPGTWDTDSRLCLRAESPRPCTVLGVVLGIKESDRT